MREGAAIQLFRERPLTQPELTSLMRGYLHEDRCARGDDVGPDAGAP